MAASTIPRKQTRRRRLGAYYTPEPIVRFMLRSCLSDLLADRLHDLASPLRILDPACGDGEFLLSALRQLRSVRHAPDGSRSPTHASNGSTSNVADAVATHLFGVDVDPDAIANLRQRFAEEIGGTSGVEDSRQISLTANFRIGDALTGSDFGAACRSRDTCVDRDTDREANGIDWARAFPQVAEAGGFDLVIGNPPYCSEKGAGRFFRHLAKSELGQRYRRPRMDLWHYFLHRGLDLLRPGGVLCYIVNAYWMSARSAQPMIARLREETTIREVVLLGEAPIFDSVAGRHMILQLQKGMIDRPCRVVDLSEISDVPTLWSALFCGSARSALPVGAREWSVPQSSLYNRGRFTPFRESPRCPSRRVRVLGELFDVRQGIAENPPFVTQAIRHALGGGLTVGDGIFVLTAEEVARLNLSPQESRLMRPYYAAKTIGRYEMPAEPAHWILYLTRRTAPKLSALPHIANHLRRFRRPLERRREVRRGCIDWWHLHWPREERLFLEPRILAVQMVHRPRFVYVERPAFVGFAVNVVRAKERSFLTLPAATAVLNADYGAAWFSQHAKRRGVALDISGTVLREFPFPVFAAATEERLTALCRRRQHIASAQEEALSVESASECAALEGEIERLIAEAAPWRIEAH